MRKMKDSGIEWIGEIPENWNYIRGKNLYSIATGKRILEKMMKMECIHFLLVHQKLN